MTPKKPTKKRLDLLVVERHLETTRARAQARILAGEVIVNDHRADKPGQMFFDDVQLRIKGDSMPFVSRGGIKLNTALKNWPGPIVDAVCIDVGASTGGFTDVLLKHGAKKVFAVDVGYGQLAYSLRQDPRVTVFERSHIGHVPVGTFVPPPTLAVVDVSFISLLCVLPSLILHLADEAFLYLLIKPQFEVGPAAVEKGGIVRNKLAREKARDKVIACAQNLGFVLLGHSESPIQGADGNIEYIAAFTRSTLHEGAKPLVLKKF